MKTNKLEALAVEIMNITGGKYTDEQEQKMMAAISTEVAKARLDELDWVRAQPKDSIWGMIAERQDSITAEVESNEV